MQLQRVWLNYREHSKTFSGSAEFSGTHGKIELNLSDAMARRVLALVAEELVECSKETARMMTGEILDQVALPALAQGESK